MKLKRCPKCRSVEVLWIEHTDHTSTFYQSADGIDPEGIHNPGMITGIEGHCLRCKHEWTPRGVRQIWDVPGYPEDDNGGET